MAKRGGRPASDALFSVTARKRGRPAKGERRQVTAIGTVEKPTRFLIKSSEKRFLMLTSYLADLPQLTAAEQRDVVKRDAILHRREAGRVWDQYEKDLVRLGTLTAVDVPMFTLFCDLAAELELSNGAMISSRMTQMRTLGCLLGMSESDRRAINPLGRKTPAKPTDVVEAERYFA